MARFSLRDILAVTIEKGAADSAKEAAAELLADARADALEHPGAMAERRVARAEAYMDLTAREAAEADARYNEVATAAAHGDMDDGGTYYVPYA